MSKEQQVLALFFNEPTKHWHFDKILKEAGISRPQASRWLKKFIKEGIIKRVKLRGKMPHYIANYGHPSYQTKKRLYALSKLEQSGFLKHLVSLPDAQTVIIFGSISRWDWYSESDLDLFIFGSAEGFDEGKYRLKLHREIQTFICKDRKELKKFKPALLKNIVEGFLVKGELDFVEVAHA